MPATNHVRKKFKFWYAKGKNSYFMFPEFVIDSLKMELMKPY